MLTLLLALGCEGTEEWGDEWFGTCDVEGRSVPVSLEYSLQEWGILEGEITLAEEFDADFDGTRSGDDVELEFWVDVNDYDWRAWLVGEVDGNDLEARLTIVGSEYETEGECALEED